VKYRLIKNRKTSYEMEGPGFESQSRKTLSLPSHDRDQLRDPNFPPFSGHRDSFSVVQKKRIEDDHLFLSRTDVKNERYCTSSSSLCLLGVDRRLFRSFSF